MAERAGLAVSAGIDVCLYQCLFSIDLSGRKIKAVPAFESPTDGGFKGLGWYAFCRFFF
jgi:hypothetical protein